MKKLVFCLSVLGLAAVGSATAGKPGSGCTASGCAPGAMSDTARVETLMLQQGRSGQEIVRVERADRVRVHGSDTVSMAIATEHGRVRPGHTGGRMNN